VTFWRNAPAPSFLTRQLIDLTSSLAKQYFLSHSLPQIILSDVFTSLECKVVSFASNPQSGGPDFCIYVPQSEIGPVLPPGTGFLFRHLLRLAELWWRYSIPPPHEIRPLIWSRYFPPKYRGFLRTARHYKPKDNSRLNNCCENHKSRTT
jgi:hypothetical protein